MKRRKALVSEKELLEIKSAKRVRKLLKHMSRHCTGKNRTKHIWLVRWFFIGGEPERACIAVCHGTQIKGFMDNSRICHCLLFHEHGKQNFVQPFRLPRKLLRYTHAWTKLHNKVMSWISGAYECHAWPLPEANSTTVCDLTVPSVGSLPLSVMVRSRIQ